MVARRDLRLPDRLKRDAIVESVLEIRFATPTVSEVFLGTMIQQWQGHQQRRLAAYDIPPQIRELDPNVRFAPTIELASPDSKSALRIGPYVLSYHRVAPYPGWRNFWPELQQAVSRLFSATNNDLAVSRIGLRYINGMTSTDHRIESLSDLDLEISIAGEKLANGVNLNVTSNLSDEFSSTVRIAGRELVQGQLPENVTVVVDVDIFTKEGFETNQQSVVDRWIEQAHTHEKTEFFRLFKSKHIADWSAQ